MQEQQEMQLFDRAAMRARIKAKRVFLYWFIPLVFVCTLVMTYNAPTYYVCSTSLSTEEMRATDINRPFTLNRPENYDLGLAPSTYSIAAEDYNEVIKSTAFICRVLATHITTADKSFEGTYYEYLMTQHHYSWLTTCKHKLLGKKRYNSGEDLPALDPFYPRGAAAEAIGLARSNISCKTNNRTKLVTLSVNAQDPLVAAMVTQATSDALYEFTTNNFLDKSRLMYKQLLDQIALTHTRYDQAVRDGDATRAAMLRDAGYSFERQAIILEAQMQNHKLFTTLNNVSVPMGKAGPKHLSTAIAVTVILSLLVLLYICRRELLQLVLPQE